MIWNHEIQGTPFNQTRTYGDAYLMEIKLGWPESILCHIICSMLSSTLWLTKTLNPCAAILRRRQHFTKTFSESQTQSRQASLTCFALKKTSTLNSLKHDFYRTWVLNQAPLSKNIRSILKDFQEYTSAKDQLFLEEFSTWHLLPTHAKGTTSCLKDTFFGTSSRLLAQTCWWVQSTAEQRNTFHVTLGAIGKS